MYFTQTLDMDMESAKDKCTYCEAIQHMKTIKKNLYLLFSFIFVYFFIFGVIMHVLPSLA